MDDWRRNPYNVRHYIRHQHRQTRVEIDKIQLLILGLSEQVDELAARQVEHLARQRKMHDLVQTTARILIICAIVAVSVYIAS